MSTQVGELSGAPPRTRAPVLAYLPSLLRVLLLLILGALLLQESAPSPARTGPAAVQLPAEAGWVMTPVFDSLIIGAPPALVVRAAVAAPAEAELEALAAVSARAPLLAVLPPASGQLRVSAPDRPRVERAAAVGFALTGPPGERVLLRLVHDTGAADSLEVTLDERGRAAGAFRVRPTRAGWHEWTLTYGSQRRRVGAWVAPADPPRLLVVAGPPIWESRFTVRALEESGAQVELLQPLGPGLEAGTGSGALPATPGALRRFDVVLAFEAAGLTATQRRALDEYAAAGGGVLMVSAAEAATEVHASGVRWTLPAELAPLPEAEVRSAVRPIGTLPPAAIAGARGRGGEPLLILQSAGRGRMAMLALTESWRWRMEAGRIVEHREFWRSLVDWLAGGVPDRWVVQPVAPLVAAGAATEVRVFATGAEGEADRFSPGEPPPLQVMRPDGSRDDLPLLPDPERPGVLRSRLVPADEGLYTLAVAGEPVSAAFRATADSGGAPDAWPRLALLADASGGALVERDSLEAELRQRTGTLPAPAPSRLPRAPLLFALVLALTASEWAIRRFTGRK